MMKRALIPIVLLLTACAKPPEDIVATAVPVDPYIRKSCVELAALQMERQQALTELEARQRATAQEDRDAMWAVHIPMASIRGGDKEKDIASAKGELQAIASASRSGGCTS
ncbi:hypothetical protein [Rhizobium sp. FKL33]|uniref:hypothetical protein n=1 Tax=Rhizobium sp. FKL33 TaxID=2562307 RepID=UPI0010C0F640|nr:hypothetical protein [Rhizobium sp. FKL33]